MLIKIKIKDSALSLFNSKILFKKKLKIIVCNNGKNKKYIGPIIDWE
jgi:hypothetical protein